MTRRMLLLYARGYEGVLSFVEANALDVTLYAGGCGACNIVGGGGAGGHRGRGLFARGIWN